MMGVSKKPNNPPPIGKNLVLLTGILETVGFVGISDLAAPEKPDSEEEENGLPDELGIEPA